ncbi:MAG: hypothetical protein FWD66_08780 [Paludibacter sp.]|nr:hypothetical protein [Paludibacter sp.]
MVIIIKNFTDYSAIFEICKNKNANFKSIELDFRQAKFINPYDVLLTVQTVIYIHRYHPDMEISLIMEGVTGKYLSDIGMVDFCSKNHIQPQTIDIIKSQTAMPIRRIDSSHIEEYRIATLQYIGSFCKGKDLTILSIGIAEAINNVHDHSQSEIGAYVFCQYFPKSNCIKVCVSDMGIGIPYKVRTFISDLSDIDCINWAIQPHNTTKSNDRNAGYGLSNIVDFVRGNKGYLQIISGTGRYIIRNGQKYTYENAINSYIGTLIEFEILVDNLEEKEEMTSQYL